MQTQQVTMKITMTTEMIKMKTVVAIRTSMKMIVMMMKYIYTSPMIGTRGSRLLFKTNMKMKIKIRTKTRTKMQMKARMMLK